LKKKKKNRKKKFLLRHPFTYKNLPTPQLLNSRFQ